MSKIVNFLTQLRVEVLSDETFILTSDFYVMLECIEEVVVPEGFITDFASVPRLPVIYLAVGNKGHKAAVLHDYLYSIKRYSREACDAYFYHALRESGVNWFYAQAMYRAVRLAGNSFYNAVKTNKEQ
jgi:hypothetical protein